VIHNAGNKPIKAAKTGNKHASSHPHHHRHYKPNKPTAVRNQHQAPHHKSSHRAVNKPGKTPAVLINPARAAIRAVSS
jgi:hypothetical protein